MMAPRPPEEPASPCMLNRTDLRSVSSKYGSIFRKRAPTPLDGQHPKLYGGYTDTQCDEFDTKWTDLDNDLGLALGLKYPWARTQYDLDALRDCVAMMRGAAAVWLRLGKEARISLNRDAYLPLDCPQHSGDPRDTHARIRRTKERLAAYGFIGFILGEKELGKETIIWLTEKGWEWINRLADPTALGEMKPRRAVGIVLRNERKKSISFPWTDEARRMDTNLTIINGTRKTARIFRADGTLLPYDPYRRIFNIEPDLSLGGRFYLPGDGNSQNMDHDDRRGLMWEIDGVLEPTAEFDGSCMHAVLAYREMGLVAPTGDLYVTDEYPRRLCKIDFHIMVNAANNPDANGSIADKLLDNEDLREGTPLNRRMVGDRYYDRKVCKQYAWGLMRAIKARHLSIKGMFCSGAGRRFQRLESDWAEAVMLSMIKHTGLCPLYVYDSFRFPARYKKTLCMVMKREARVILGIDLDLKEDSRARHLDLLPPSEPADAMDSIHSSTPTTGDSVLHLEDSSSIYLSTCTDTDGLVRGKTLSERDSASSLPLQTHALPVSRIRRTDQDRGPPYG